MTPSAPWAVLDVEIADGLAALPRSLSRPALVIFRLHGAVLGKAHLLPSELPMTPAESAGFIASAIASTSMELARLGAADLLRRAKTAPATAAGLRIEGDVLERLDSVFARRQEQPPRRSASIVVAGAGRTVAELSACLSALADEARKGRELLVVGDVPTPEVALDDLPGARYLPLRQSGASHARNTGLRAATGDVVLFTEADAQAEPGWADALLRRFDDPGVVLAGGLVLPSRLETDAQIASFLEPDLPRPLPLPQAFDSGSLDGWRRGPPFWEIGATANMAVRRDAALRVGGFDAKAGPAAEADLWMRLLRAGGHARFEPLAVVRQTPPEAWKEARRSAYEMSRGRTAGLLLAYGRHGAQGALANALLARPRRLLARVARAPGRWLAGDPDRLLGAAFGGYLAGLGHLVSALRRAVPEPTLPLDVPDARRDA